VSAAATSTLVSVTTTVLAPPPKRRFGRRERHWREDVPRLRRARPAVLSTVITLALAVSVFRATARGLSFGVEGIGVIVFIGFITLSIKQPRLSVLGIVVWVPLQEAVLAYALHKGAPLILVRGLGFLKEFWEISLVFVAVRGVRGQPRRRLDRLDAIAALYVALSLFYLVLPVAIHGTLGGLPFGVRLNAWRLETIYVVVFLAIRQLTFDPQFVKDLRRAAMVVGTVIAAFAIWEATDNHGFNTFLVNTLDYPDYRIALTGLAYSDPGNVLFQSTVGSASVVRAGSLFNDPLVLGFFSLIPLGIAIERLSAKKLSLLALVAAGGAGAAVVFSGTRSAVLGAAAGVVVALIAGIRFSPGRYRLLLVLGLAVALALPSASHSSLRARFEGIFTGGSQDADNQEPINASRAALSDVLAHPGGRGLGANTSTGTRYGTTSITTAEDSYLETGEEFGLWGALLFLVLLGALLIELRGRSKLGGVRGELAGGLFLAGCGLLLGGFFLQVWLQLNTALMFWVLSAVALSEPSDGSDEDPVESVDDASQSLARAPFA
jgi:hypothetical protein